VTIWDYMGTMWGLAFQKPPHQNLHDTQREPGNTESVSGHAKERR